jgi:hypothetical protein
MLGKLLPYPNSIQLGARQPNNNMKFNHFRKKLTMDSMRLHSKKTYKIRVKGIPDHGLFDWMEELEIIPQDNSETVLISSFTDQPALRGFVDFLWNLNFTVISVERIDNENIISERRSK